MIGANYALIRLTPKDISRTIQNVAGRKILAEPSPMDEGLSISRGERVIVFFHRVRASYEPPIAYCYRRTHQRTNAQITINQGK